MTILVTGGAGFIGSNFILSWFKNNDEPIVNLDKLTSVGTVENLDSISQNENYSFVKGDIKDRGILTQILSHHTPRAIINFAAESHVDRSIRDPLAFVETNIVGTFQLLETARFFWQSLAELDQISFRFLQISTDEVYGSLQTNDPGFNEQTAYSPNSPYSASKASSDHFVQAYRQTYGLPTLTTCCSNNYGPRQFPEKLIPLIIKHSLEGRKLPIYGDGMQIRDWLYVDDHCAAIRSVLDGGNVGEIYNIGGNNEWANIEIVHKVCSLLDNKKPRKDQKPYSSLITHVTDRPGHDRRYAIDTTKIERELGWVASESFESGLEKTVDWYLSNQDWVDTVTGRQESN